MICTDPNMVRPIYDRVFVRINKENLKYTTTEGGIYVPESISHTEQCLGEVVAVGPGKIWEVMPYKGRFVATYVRPGDRILFAMEGAEPLFQFDTEEHHYEMLRSEIYILGTI